MMGVPIRYNLRNLVVRKGSTLMTAFGIGLTVAVLVIAVALTIGLGEVFSGSGDARQFLVLRKGADAELSSTVSDETYQLVRRLPGIATTKDGEPMVSPEGVTVVNLPSVDSPTGMNVTVRGLTPIGYAMRDVSVLTGRSAAPGLREVVVGESVSKRYPAAQVGRKVKFGRGEWEVVGVFKVGETAANSEIWTDLNQLRGDFEQQGGSSSLLVRVDVPTKDAQTQLAASAAENKKINDEYDAAVAAAKKADQPPESVPKPPTVKPGFIKAFNIDDDQRMNCDTHPEKAYYAKLTEAGIPLMGLGYSVAIIMAIGSGFAAANTMYAAVARRNREIATLRAIGFGRGAILRSFVLESICLALIGGVVGILLALPINGLTTGVGNFSTFSETAFKFRVGWLAIGVGLTFAIVIGFIGGLLPAWAAARTGIVQAMREG